MPSIMTSTKSLMTMPPKQNMTTTTRKVVTLVRIVRLRVLLIAMLMISRKLFSTVQLTLSKMKAEFPADRLLPSDFRYERTNSL